MTTVALPGPVFVWHRTPNGRRAHAFASTTTASPDALALCGSGLASYRPDDRWIADYRAGEVERCRYCVRRVAEALGRPA